MERKGGHVESEVGDVVGDGEDEEGERWDVEGKGGDGEDECR